MDRGSVEAPGERALREAVASGQPPPAALSWLPLSPSQVAVVPRLGGLVTIDAFTDEVDRAARPSRFLYRPGRLD